MTTAIVINAIIAGFHNWPEAPGEVDFLRYRHRHIFHIRCEKVVSHLDRDIEIILFKNSVLKYIEFKYLSTGGHPSIEFGSMSCEMIATELLNQFQLISCEVLEDNENGAKVYK